MIGPVKTFPDWGISPGQFVAPDIDIAELAVRMGGASRLYRGGRVLSSTNFSPSLDGWIVDNPGTVRLVNSQAMTGYGSLKFNNGLAVESRIRREIPVGVNNQFGIEYSWYPEILVDPCFIYTWIVYRDNGAEYYGIFEFNTDNGELKYQRNAGVFELIDTFPSMIRREYWYSFKAVIDFDNKVYKYFYMNNKEFILPQPLVNGMAWNTDNISIHIYAWPTVPGNVFEIYLDNVVITVGES
jgi:hypothetical protein